MVRIAIPFIGGIGTGIFLIVIVNNVFVFHDGIVVDVVATIIASGWGWFVDGMGGGVRCFTRWINGHGCYLQHVVHGHLDCFALLYHQYHIM